jgi:hypothetical protein
MGWIPGIDADHAYPILAPTAVVGHVVGIAVEFCSLDHLRLMKRTAGRPQDLLDLTDLASVDPAGA